MKNFLFILLIAPAFVFGQAKQVYVEGNSPDLYVVHTTGPKESFYSIGRIYNISPKVFAPYNNLVLEKGLAIGQVVKIPLNEINFTQDGNLGADEVLIPVYHKVKPKETLYNISTRNNKVPVATLKQWNKLATDAVPNGANLIIGYLKVKKDLSPLAVNAVKQDVIKTAPESTVQNTVVKQETDPEPVKVEKKPEVVKPEPVVTKQKAEPKRPETTTAKNPVRTESGSPATGGVFSSLFQKVNTGKQTRQETGLAATFKSTSGWQDGKYYCLHNGATAGTIIKITNPVNQRSVYAKVLDIIPDLKQNEGVIIRLSNAAANELGVITDTFDCILNF